jgi:hypothetical protein
MAWEGPPRPCLTEGLEGFVPPRLGSHPSGAVFKIAGLGTVGTWLGGAPPTLTLTMPDARPFDPPWGPGQHSGV